MSDRPIWAGQVVPRPPQARPGARAPWEDLSPDERRHWSVARVRSALEGAGLSGRPPDAAGLDEVPILVHDARVPDTAMRPSAVLLALFEDPGAAEARIVLTRRSGSLRAHTGQVSFPGGRMDPGEDAPAAARREAFEEIALEPSSVEPIGWLHLVHTVASGSLITPVVARLPGRPVLVPNPAEVARVFDVALTDLMEPGVYSEEVWMVPERTGDVPGAASGGSAELPVVFYDLGHELVWGATARILTELLTLLHADRNRRSTAP